MSTIGRILPRALCCFLPPANIEDENTEPSPSRPASTAPTVPRKPTPYAMINVPHAPEMTDVHEFRRLFTQSPACPHEDTPIGGSPDRLRTQGSLDLNYAFHSGSPASAPKARTSLQRISQHLKQKISEMSVSSSGSALAREGCDHQNIEQNRKDPAADEEAIMLGLSMRSTGLTDFLRSREGSVDAYDSDAQTIKTPYLQSAVGTMRIASSVAPPHRLSEAEILPKDSVSNYESSPKPSLAKPAISQPLPGPIAASVHQHGFKQGPTQLAPATTVMNLDTTKSDNSDPNQESETEHVNISARDKLKLFSSHSLSEHGGVFLNDQRKSVSAAAEPETPQTIVKYPCQNVSDIEHSRRHDDSANRATTLLKDLDPALLEYLSSCTPVKPDHHEPGTLPTRASISGKTPTAVHMCAAKNGSNRQHEKHDDLPHQSHTDLASLNSEAPSERSKSVHLFNMHISRQLASKSTANMLSPSTSARTSRKSIDLSGPYESDRLADSLSFATVVRPTGVRAEHVRRPSDPQTRQLFEQFGHSARPAWMQRSFSVGRSQLGSRDRDDASSFYAQDHGSASSNGNLSFTDGCGTSFRNMNSLAVGGRALSTTLPKARSTLAHGQSHHSSTRPIPDQLGGIIQDRDAFRESFDGTAEQRTSLTTGVTPNEYTETSEEQRVSHKPLPAEKCIPRLQIDTEPSRRLSAGWLNSGQRQDWDYAFASSNRSQDRRLSTLSMIAPDADPATCQESATDMWNRAFHDARNSASRDLLSTPTIEMDSLRRPSSLNTIRPKHRSSVALQTPEAVVRRSRSAGPSDRETVLQAESSSRRGLTKKLTRLSLRQLKISKESFRANSGARKLQKKHSPPNVTAASETSPTPEIRINSSSHTTPTKERLGIWASFPMKEFAKRNGPASELDRIVVRDFCGSGSRNIDNTWVTPEQPISPAEDLSPWSNKHKSRNLADEDRYLRRVHKPRRVLFLHRWRRFYRTRSSEWHGYRTTGGHRSSVSAGQSAEFPELESLPGEGLFGRAYGTFDGASNTSGTRHKGQGGNDYTTNSKSLNQRSTFPRTGTANAKEDVRWLRTTDSSLWEPVFDQATLHRDRLQVPLDAPHSTFMG